jgi:hypothetical protein
MALTISQLFAPVQLGNADAVLFTMPSTPSTLVCQNMRVRLTNTDTSPRTVTLNVDAAATGSGVANRCLSAKSIAANDYLDVDIPVMKAGDTLRGLADTAAKVTMHQLSGSYWS